MVSNVLSWRVTGLLSGKNKCEGLECGCRVIFYSLLDIGSLLGAVFSAVPKRIPFPECRTVKDESVSGGQDSNGHCFFDSTGPQNCRNGGCDVASRLVWTYCQQTHWRTH